MTSTIDELVAHAQALGLAAADLEESMLDVEHDDAGARVNAAGGPLSAADDEHHADADARAARISQQGLRAQVARLVDGYGPTQARSHLDGVAASPLRVLRRGEPAEARARRAA
jgi:hypothetical protein